ncbi:MAG: FMN reductase (NAD(P)H) [Syntrophorhabdus sp. PtaU1.Bin058]|nr:MAG: FMN reductase (NAD(P)H) [Syntrophorhabdus sp. PtaU1.Bin058]
MDLLKVIHERRSIRKYRQDAVPEEIIIEILEAARRSPSWANTQVWRFIVVKDREIKNRISSEVLSGGNPARQAIIDAPVLICVAAKRGLSGFHKDQPATDKGDWFMFDAGIAMEHIVLAAWNFGLGTVHVGSFNAKKAEEILKIPDGFSITEMTPLGYFDETPGEAPRFTPRKPLKEIAYLNTFGTEYIKE